MKHAVLVSILVLSAASAQADPAVVRNGMLTDKNGRVLYTFDKDSKGKSACAGGCLAAWPPFAAQPAARPDGDFSLITRDDGSMQWALRGQPLYYFAGDSQAGDAKGDQVGGVWHVVRQNSKPLAKPDMPNAYNAPGTSYTY